MRGRKMTRTSTRVPFGERSSAEENASILSPTRGKSPGTVHACIHMAYCACTCNPQKRCISCASPSLNPLNQILNKHQHTNTHTPLTGKSLGKRTLASPGKNMFSNAKNPALMLGFSNTNIEDNAAAVLDEWSALRCAKERAIGQTRESAHAKELVRERLI